MSNIPQDVQNVLMLQSEEHAVTGFQNVKVGGEVGTVVLTNMRLIFVRNKRGYNQESFSFTLEGIYEMNMKKSMMGGPKLMINGKTFQAQDPGSIQKATNDLKQQRMAQVGQGTGGGKDGRYGLGTYVFDEPGQQAPQVVKEKVIKEVIKIRCQFCGKTYVETKDGCPYCGAGH
ncbi:MAG: hypothetical protein KAT70_00050 [Thermoplasmata archaeon]|nr:hypothetical protein [Thermoplasmata archaeon]